MVDHSGSRGPREVGRGPRRDLGDAASSLRARLGDIDRAGRFRRRLAAVRSRRGRRTRRRRWGRRTALALLAAGAVLVGFVVAELIGAVVGLTAVAVVLGVAMLARRLARSRGAAAWDWEAGRYRMLGDPSARVQALDTEDPPRGPLPS